MRNLIFLVLVIGLTNCSPTDSGNTTGGTNFKVQEFVNSQIHNKKLHTVKFEKTVSIDGNSESRLISESDSSFWKKEFTYLSDLDLNKPTVDASFLISKGQSDDGSNLLVDRYVLKEEEESELKYFYLAYLENQNDVRRIEFHQQSGNQLFFNERSLHYYFSPYSAETQPDSIIANLTQWRFGTDTVNIETRLVRAN